jgi:PKD repeat protein
MSLRFIKQRILLATILAMLVISSSLLHTTNVLADDDCSDNHAPTHPTNPFPSASSTDVPRNVVLTWDCSDPDNDELVYDVYLDTNLPAHKQASKQSNTTFRPDLLQFNTRYYWMIIAYDPCGRIAISKLWSFVTEENIDPHPPVITSFHPVMNEENVSLSASLSITVTDEDLDTLQVTFYDETDTVIDIVEAMSGDTVSTIWTNLTKNTLYEWHVTVSDGEYHITSPTYQFTTTNDNAPPLADAGNIYQGTVDEDIIFDASESYDPDGTIIGYRWDYTNDGTWDTEWLQTKITTHVFTDPGRYTVVLEVKDNNNETSQDTATVHITTLDRSEPYAQFTISPTNPLCEEVVTFDASLSYDPDGSVTGYRWDFTGVGVFTTWQTDESITYSYDTNGSYTATLEIRDDDDMLNVTSMNLYVGENHAPTTPSQPNGPTTASQNSSISFSTSSTDPDDHRIRYGWDWDNDSSVDQWTDYFTSGSNIQASHMWTNTGSYCIQVRAQDEFGITSDFSEKTTITITSASEETLCPSIPSNPSPNNNSDDVSLIGRYFEWECEDPDFDAIKYTIYLNTTPNFDTPAKENILESRIYLGTLQKDTTYYWKVAVIDENDSCYIEGPIWQFTTINNSQPSQPQKPYPANGQTNVDPCGLTLSWECIDPDNDELAYTVFFDDTSSPSKTLVSGITSSSASSVQLSYDKTYYWYIQATDKKGEDVNGIVWSFKTKPTPCKAVIAGPADTFSGKEVTFSGSQSTCENGLIAAYQWDFGDGETGMGETVTHVFHGNETFKVTLSITCKPDCLSCSDSTVQSIHVGNHPPQKPEIVHNDILSFIGGQIQGTYSFTVKGTDADGDQIRFRFEWGDNSSNTITDYVNSGEEVTVTHAWMKEGTYDIKVYAEDAGGDVSAPVTITTSIGSAVNIAMFVIVLIGVIIVTVQVVFVFIAHKKKMFQ